MGLFVISVQRTMLVVVSQTPNLPSSCDSEAVTWGWGTEGRQRNSSSTDGPFHEFRPPAVGKGPLWRHTAQLATLQGAAVPPERPCKAPIPYPPSGHQM